MKDFVEVFISADLQMAYLVKAHLEDADIPVMIDNENLVGAYCMDGMVPRVLVPPDKVERAMRILETFQNGSSDDWDDEEE